MIGNEFAEELKNRILSTMHLLYKSKGVFYNFVKLLEDDVSSAMTYGSEKGYKDVSLPIMAVIYMSWASKKVNDDSVNVIDQDELEEILQKIWVEYFWQRLFKEDMSKLVSFNFEENLVAEYMKNIEGKKILEKFWSSKDIVRSLTGGNLVNCDIDLAGEDSIAKLFHSGLTTDKEARISFALMQQVNTD